MYAMFDRFILSISLSLSVIFLLHWINIGVCQYAAIVKCVFSLYMKIFERQKCQPIDGCKFILYVCLCMRVCIWVLKTMKYAWNTLKYENSRYLFLNHSIGITSGGSANVYSPTFRTLFKFTLNKWIKIHTVFLYKIQRMYSISHAIEMWQESMLLLLLLSATPTQYR